MPEPGDRPDDAERPEPPDYTVYKSRPSLRDRFRKPDLGGLTDRLKRSEGGDGGEKPPKAPSDKPWWRRALKWAGIAIAAWIFLSFVAFGISAQIQKGKLADGITDKLDGGPAMLFSSQTILVLGTDVRSGAFAGPDEAESDRCVEAITSGRPKDGSCKNAPYRSDTIMLIQAGGGTFRKLSIPRDTLADIPGQGPQKINSAYASGGAKLAIETVEGLLGIEIDQVAIIDFQGFREFIDAIGGITVDLPTDVCTSVSDGTFEFKLDAGEHELGGLQAITLARTRSNSCGEGEFTGTDVERAQFQQLILDGIKGRLTSITSAPINFLKGPLIGWNAPKAMVSSMGFLTMPQFVISAATGGGGGTDVLTPSSTTGAGNLVVSQAECERAAEELLGEEPPKQPNCPQG